MRFVIVRYKLKQDRVSEHEQLIRAVFDELAGKAPPDFSYGAFKEPDGVSFVHFAVLGAENPLQGLPAFKAFSEKIGERCDEPPRAVDLTQVAAFGF